MLPRPGTAPDNVRGRLHQLVTTAYNQSEAVDYALWVDAVEGALRECFVDVPFERLYSERYWRLTTGPHVRPHELLRAEQRVQVDWLEQIRTATDAMIDRFSTPTSVIAVLDTHIVLHAKPLEEIDWCAMLATDSVRLVVPLRVVDEMDQKKYGRRADLRTRARNRLRLLARYLDEGDVRPHVRVEVVSWRDLDPGGVPRPPIPPDTDILDTCEALRFYAAGNAVSVVTHDVTMQLLARERDVPVTLVDAYDMQDGSEEDQGS